MAKIIGLSARGFNPHSHVGSDTQVLTAQNQLQVSIHTPTWGVTVEDVEMMLCKMFQSTLPRGE